MLKHKQIGLISFLSLLALGLFAMSGQSQPPAAARASGLGLQRHAGSHARPSRQNLKSKRQQQPEAVSLTFGLIDFPRSTASNAFGLNSKGDIVGGYGPIPPWPAAYWETTGYWLKGNTYRTLAYPGAAYSAPYSINDKRVIVGFYDMVGDQNFRGYQYKGGEFTNIDYPGATVTGPVAINNAGEITGLYFDSSNEQHGFTLKNGVYATLDVPNLYVTEPYDINSKGDIVGSCYDLNDIEHGFVYQNGQFAIVDYPGATNTEVTGINDAGQMIGVYGDGVMVAGNYYQVSNLFLFDHGTFTPLTLPVETQAILSYSMKGDEFVGFYVDSTNNLYGFEAQIADGSVSQISRNQQ